MNAHTIDYTVGDHLVIFAVYGDGDLDDKEVMEFEAFEAGVKSSAPHGCYFSHWAVGDGESSPTICDVTGLYNTCHTLTAVFLPSIN